RAGEHHHRLRLPADVMGTITAATRRPARLHGRIRRPLPHRTRLSARVRVARADRVRSLHRRLLRRARAPTAVAAPNRRIGGVNPYLVDRLQPFGTTIFAEMSALAVETGAINLGQGFPDTDGPDAVRDAAIEAINA